MSNLKKSIDFKVLENELDEALKADELYKLQNDAKFRAIEQRVPTYDHFSDMVKAAHLKAVERSEFQKKVDVSWNHCYKCLDEEELLFRRDDRSNNDDLNVMINEPKTSTEFLKTWIKLNRSEDKFEFLLRFRDRLKSEFFQSEIPTDFLKEFFHIACDICSVESALLIIYFLKIFVQCNRFSLNLAMISERKYSQLLFDKLLTLLHDDKSILAIENLAQTYGVILTAKLC